MAPLAAGEPTAEQIDHFEKKVRPLLVENCNKCHSQATKKGPKGGLRTDGRAFLVKGGDSGPAVVPGFAAKSRLIEAVRYKNVDLLMPPTAKLPDEAIRDLEKWVNDGAPWPDDKAAVDTKVEFDLAKRKKDHWAWQPLATPLTGQASSVDGFLKAKWAEQKLTPAAPANNLTLLRRVTFALTGLPPTPVEIAAFQEDASPNAYEKVVDRLLASPQFGERWGRHWLDLVRYAESRGHEFEPDIANAYQYRDYVIRALNADVPYDQFVREHLAGDVLPTPRLGKDGANESLVGTGFWHLGEEVHSPVDVRQDEADRFDNRIDVATKAFLGLTVACARCHDHKFDAIAAKDYYALFGILEGASYRQARIDGWKQNHEVAAELVELRRARTALLAPGIPASHAMKPDAKFAEWLAKSGTVVDYANPKPGEWLPDDVTFGPGPIPAGTPRLVGDKLTTEPVTAAVFDRFWAGLKLAPGVAPDYGPLGSRPRAGFSIRTPSFVLDKKRVHALVRGGGEVYAAVAQHTVLAGPLHGSLYHVIPDSAQYRWVTFDLSGYVGQRLHLELSADSKTDFAVALVVQADDIPPGVPFDQPKTQPIDSGVQSALVDLAAKAKALSAKAAWESRQVPAMWDGTPVESPVFVRGNPRTLGVTAPRRSLEAFAGPHGIAATVGSGRLELAEQWTDPARTPLIARVAINRVWHHLFGRGLVASTDNFGVLGERPTHPELLDFLAVQFTNPADKGGMGWSAKALIRALVLTDAYRMASTGDAASDAADPANLLLHKFHMVRLEGEVIRDAMLSVSGRLDPKPFGPSVPIHLTPFLDGRGRPGVSGPEDGNGRRSIYLSVRRNFLSPFLLAFDTPIPFSTVGRRQVSNVPAQALILMNDPFVHEQAARWAKAVLARPGTTEDRVRGMYIAAFGRPPTTAEVKECAGFVTGHETDDKTWTDLAHALFNVKDFVFVR